ncbi:MAG: YitT family protein [Bacillus sp. (in: firmicutes)]
MWKQKLREFNFILIGSCLLSAGLYHINYQNNLAEGGFLGVALLIENIFSISPSLTTLLLDLPILLFALRMFGKSFIYKSFLGSISFSGFYSLFENYSSLTLDFSNHMLLAAILGGMFTGIGLGLILKSGGTTGGDDVLSIVINQLTKLSIGKVYFIFDAIVLTISLYYLNWHEFGYTLIAVAVSAKMTDLIIGDFKEKANQQAAEM